MRIAVSISITLILSFIPSGGTVNAAGAATFVEPLVCDLQVAENGSTLMPNHVVEISGKKFIDVRGDSVELPLCGKDTTGQGTASAIMAANGIRQTRNFYQNYLDIDITEEFFLGNVSTLNGIDTSTISAFTNVCSQTDTGNLCPLDNAFWVPWNSSECQSQVCSGIFLGNRMERADDVIAHELTHGVTFALAFDNILPDDSETAALSEGISDTIGEAVDQLTVSKGEKPDKFWLIGEAVQQNGFRSMRYPEIRRVTQAWKHRDSHTNSGPINRLAYLLANGGKSNTSKIKPIGTKSNSGLCTSPNMCSATIHVAQLTLQAVRKLPADANFFDFARSLSNSCDSFIKLKKSGFTSATCLQVRTALQGQGLTKFKIRGLTNLGTVTKNQETTVSARLTTTTGAAVRNQPVKLQTWTNGKWKTIRTVKTNSLGQVSYLVPWKVSKRYRLKSVTNAGLFSATSKVESVRVN